MKIKLVQDAATHEPEILIKYATMSKDLERILAMIQSADTKIKCTHDGGEVFINIADVFYFESVDKSTFVYCEQEVYGTELRLYQIVEEFSHLGFVQISKACVLNINVLESIAPLINSRMEATLKNGERLIVTRKYLGAIKHALQEWM